MLAIIQFLKRFSPMLRSGKMSYSDALTRFRAQFGRPPDGLELTSIRKEVEKAPSNVFDLTGKQIDTSRPIIGGKNVAETEAQVKERLLKTQRETLERLRNKKKTVEDFSDEGDFDPGGMASGGLARVGMFLGGQIPKGLMALLKNIQKKFGKKALYKGDEVVIDNKIFKRSDKNRPATEEELQDDYAELWSDETSPSDFGSTIDELDSALAEQKAYMADMKSQYMRGDLDKYVRPEVLEEQRLFRQKKIDDVLDKAYDEVFYQKPSSGDYKYDADVLSDSIAEQIGKGAFDELPQTYQPQIHNTALKRVTQDMQMKRTLKDVEQKMQLSDFDVTGRKKNASGGIAGQLHLNEGGRVPMIFGGSAGLRAMIKNMIEGINKGRKSKIKTLFPKYSVEEKELLKLGEKYLPRDAANLAAREIEGKAEGIQVLIDRLKNDKKIIEQMAKNKAMNDPGLDFLMKHLEKMENMYPPNLKKYTDIDKDILQLETIKKNILMKDRKLNAEGGRASLSNGGLANILGA